MSNRDALKLLMECITGAIREDFQGSNFPYTYGGKAPGFGVGTGLGGASYSKPNRGSTGGNRLRPDPMKPYTSEFANDVEAQRDIQWRSVADDFNESVDLLIRDIGMARNKRDIELILDAFTETNASEFLSKILTAKGAYDSFIGQGHISKAKEMLSSDIKTWAKAMLSKGSKLSKDAGSLEMYSSYDGVWKKDNRDEHSGIS